MSSYTYMPASVTFPRSYCPPEHTFMVVRHKGETSPGIYSEWVVPRCKCRWFGSGQYAMIHEAFTEFLVKHMCYVVEQKSLFDEARMERLRQAFGG